MAAAPAAAAAWEQQSRESSRAFAAFVTYRDLGPSRSLGKVGERVGKNGRLLEGWCSQWRWVERAQAWDMELDRQKLDAMRKEARDMGVRHARVAMVFQNKAIERLQSLEAKTLTPDQALRYFAEAVKIERLARGEPTEINRTAAVVDDDLLSECAEIAVMLSAVKNRPVTMEEVLARYRTIRAEMDGEDGGG